MNFNDTKEEAQFRKEVQAWLGAHANRRPDHESGRSVLEEYSVEDLDEARRWQRTKADAGYARITWPLGMGGISGTPIQSIIFHEEESKYDVPKGWPFAIGLGMCIPTLMAYGNEESKNRYVLPAVRGDEIWCQLFSESHAGSDVAGLRTRATRVDDKWIINGSKTWNTGATISDFGLLLARTDFDAPKHKGLTMFYFSMKSLGVQIKPIRQMSGASGFSEVFFEDLEIPDSQRLGEVGQGWDVAVTTLMHERLAVGGGEGGGLDVKEMIECARRVRLDGVPAIENTHVREKLADWYTLSAGLRFTTLRTMTALSKGEQPGPEASVAKVIVASKLQELSSFALELQGETGVLRGDDAMFDGVFQEAFLGSAGLRIAGGTDEILKNIIAERVLGLPVEPRVDKNVPFREVPSGK